MTEPRPPTSPAPGVRFATPSTSVVPPTYVVAPKRGGIHPSTYGLFIGGAKLDNDYTMTTTSSSTLYRYSTQRRHEKTIGSIEKSLRDARDSATAIKFNGKLEPAAGSNTEIGKERFVQLLKKRVIEHGQQTFYYIREDPLSTDPQPVVNLFDYSHRVKLDAVVSEHKRRCMSTDPPLFEQYDQIEYDDIELSRVVVDYMLTKSFREKIEIHFGHRDDFETLPGSCLFIMALETCNASVSHNVEGARKTFEGLQLATNPGENITDWASEAQRLVKIMQGDYAIPVNTSSKLINQVTKTSSEFFNRKMFALLDKVKMFEGEYRLSDPRLITKDVKYSTLGPLGIIATLQAVHGTLLPSVNLSSVSNPLDIPSGNPHTMPPSLSTTFDSHESPDDPDELVFHGMWCAPYSDLPSPTIPTSVSMFDPHSVFPVSSFDPDPTLDSLDYNPVFIRTTLDFTLAFYHAPIVIPPPLLSDFSTLSSSLDLHSFLEREIFPLPLVPVPFTSKERSLILLAILIGLLVLLGSNRFRLHAPTPFYFPSAFVPTTVTTSYDSAPSSMAFAVIASDPYSLVSTGQAKHAVIFDTGASLGITFDVSDFDGPITKHSHDLRLGGMAQGFKNEGSGPVSYTFRNDDGTKSLFAANAIWFQMRKCD